MHLVSLFTHLFWGWCNKEKEGKKGRNRTRGGRKLLGFGERNKEVQQHPAGSTTTPSRFSPPCSISPAAMPRGGILIFGVGRELTSPCWQTGAPQGRQTGLCKGGQDHRLAILGGIKQLGTFFNFFPPPTQELFRRVGTQRYLYSFQTKASHHHLTAQFEDTRLLSFRDDKLILPVTAYTATNSDPLKSKAAPAQHRHCLLHLGSLGRAKPSLQGSESQNSSERLESFCSMTERIEELLLPPLDKQENSYHKVLSSLETQILN